MDLALPLNIGYGEKLDTADCYSELCIYPGGHFLMRVSVRANSPSTGASIHAGFALFDANGAAVERRTFGMNEDEATSVPPVARGFPPERSDTIAGVVPAELLARTERIAICFRAKGTSPDWEKLQKRVASLA
jgi:hypothetical protein